MSAVLSTERFVVRPWSDDDLDVAYGFYSQPEMVRFLGFRTPHASRDDTRAWLERVRLRNAEYAEGEGFWAVVDRETGAVVGAAVFHLLPGSTDMVEIGWHVGIPYQGRGYATEVGRALVEYARGRGLPVVYAVIDAANAPSIRVAEKLGMRYVRHTDDYYDNTPLELYELPLV